MQPVGRKEPRKGGDREIDVENLRKKLQRSGEWARTNLAAAQANQKGMYDDSGPVEGVPAR